MSNKLYFAALLMVAVSVFLFSSCNKQESQQPQEEMVQVVFTYTLSTSNGQEMTPTKTSHTDVWKEFYQAISNGSLIAPEYTMTLTEKTTGGTYSFSGKWSSPQPISIKTGTYTVTGQSTASGESIQEKCSILLGDEIAIDGSKTEIMVKARYDCSLLAFTDSSIKSLSNFNGETSTDFFTYNSYRYGFINSTLYLEGHKSEACINGESTDGSKFTIKTGALTFDKGKYYIYDNIKTGFLLEEMEEGGFDGNVINLSANGTANCYMVNAAGKYSFNAKVKGNGTESVGTLSEVETLWESFNSSSTPNAGDIIKDVQLIDGIIYFTATGKEGNALLAVKNSSGTILWSWHIWATKYNPDTDYDIYKNQSGVKVMDRNLGALSSVAGDYRSLGFYYQWGRKDPLPSSSSIDSYVMMLTVPSSVFNTVSSSSSVGTVDYSVQHPTTAIKESSNLDWMYSPDNSLWSTKKTQYDPCPKGWKVPDISLYSAFTSTNDYVRDHTNKVVKFGTSVSTPETFFPCCGTIGGGDLSSGAGEFAISCHYWSNTGNRFCIYDDYAPSISYYSFRSHGLPVRCCAE